MSQERLDEPLVLERREHRHSSDQPLVKIKVDVVLRYGGGLSEDLAEVGMEVDSRSVCGMG